MRRAAVRSVVVALAWLALLVAPAAADPAQPGDVRSRVTELAPRTTGVRAEIVGGDSFLQLEVDRGREVVVLGYESEPYLRVRPDGTVEVNDRSPARWVNDDRLGSAAVPDTADASASPDWRGDRGGREGGVARPPDPLDGADEAGPSGGRLDGADPRRRAGGHRPRPVCLRAAAVALAVVGGGRGRRRADALARVVALRPAPPQPSASLACWPEWSASRSSGCRGEALRACRR